MIFILQEPIDHKYLDTNIERTCRVALTIEAIIPEFDFEFFESECQEICLDVRLETQTKFTEELLDPG